MSSTTIWDQTTSTCGNSMVGMKTETEVFTFTTTGAKPRPGGIPVRTTAGVRFGSTCGITPPAGWSSGTSMAYAGMRLVGFATCTATTMIRGTTFQMAGP